MYKNKKENNKDQSKGKKEMENRKTKGKGKEYKAGSLTRSITQIISSQTDQEKKSKNINKQHLNLLHILLKGY